MRRFKSALFAASALFCLLLPNAQAKTHHATLPAGAFFVFSFPGYTSLHNCDFFQDQTQALSTKTCIDMLKKEQKTAEKDAKYAESDFFRAFIGNFGKNPLLYDKAKILVCESDCRELKAQRSGPPDMLWSPPQITKQGISLVYPLPHSVPRKDLKLALLLADGEWRSNVFTAGFWQHNYMLVHVDKNEHALIVERDWQKTLSDSANHLALWQHVRLLIVPCLFALLLAIPGLLLAKWRFHWRWKQSGRIFLWHLITLILTITLAMLSIGETLTLTAALLFYLGGMLPEWWLLQRGNDLKRKHVFLAQMLMRLPLTLLLIMIFVCS